MYLFNYKVCNPAFFYFTVSILGTIVMLIQNREKDTHCVGNVNCRVPNSFITNVVNIITIIFWTWVVNIICSYGWVKTAWGLVLLPFIFMGLVVAVFAFSA